MIEKEHIQKFKLFEGIGQEALDHILSLGQEMTYDDKAVILEESSLSNDLFVILDGRVNVAIDAFDPENGQRKKALLTTLRHGEAFGEIAFLEGKRRSAYITAIDKARILRIEGKKLYPFFKNDFETGYRFMRNLALILAQRLEDINFMWRDNIRPVI
jgi:CRP-like cAMP-binding protein